MAITTSRMGLFMSTIVDRLRARPELAGVRITSAFVGTEPVEESIHLEGGDGIMEWGSIGNFLVNEKFGVQGVIYVRKLGADEAAYRATRDRVFELFREIQICMREDIGGVVVQDDEGVAAVQVASVSNYSFDQGTVDATWRVAEIEFEFECTARLPRS